MNKRIRELVEQAVKAVDNPFPGNPLNDELEKMYIPDCFAKKFAELIVRECSKIIVNGGYWNPAFGERRPASPPEIAMMVKEYFGVEE